LSLRGGVTAIFAKKQVPLNLFGRFEAAADNCPDTQFGNGIFGNFFTPLV
jgi:hypothetical protein